MDHESFIGWIQGPSNQDEWAKKVIDLRDKYSMLAREKYCVIRDQETATRRLMARRARRAKRARRRITGDQISGGSLLRAKEDSRISVSGSCSGSEDEDDYPFDEGCQIVNLATLRMLGTR